MDSEEKLIEFVRSNPSLYDKTHRDFKDSVKKKDIWESIGVNVGLSGEAAQKRWSNLRDAFNNYNKKVKSQKSGDEFRKLKKYRYADILQFLLPFMKQRETSGNLVENFSDVDESESTSPEVESEQASGSVSPKPSQCISSPKILSRKRKDRSQDIDTFMLDYFKEKREQINKEDDIDHFFKSMACTVRQFPVHVQSEIKFEIHQIIHRVELKMLSQNPEV